VVDEAGRPLFGMDSPERSIPQTTLSRPGYPSGRRLSWCASLKVGLAPRTSHFDPLSELFPESPTQHGLESLYKLESIGISDNSEPSDYDLARIEKFKRGVELRGKQYYVEFPWHKEILQKVPNGLEIATFVAHHVHANLTKKS
jgi:hypothetical protein